MEGDEKMIQDITPYVYKNEYNPRRPEKDSYLLYYKGRELFVKMRGEEMTFPTFGELEERNPRIYEDATYLFSIDDMRFYLAEELVYEETENDRFLYKEEFRRVKPQHMAFAGITGFQLYNWYRSHRFCGRCGQPMKKDEKERMLYCESCHQMEYPKICPAVIVGVTDGNRLLLSKYADREYKKYALLAGFAEIGETIEQTIEREVMEEVGVKVKNITYYKSQPWSFTDTLLLGFFAELDGSAEITLDEEELALAEWFEREEIPVVEKNISLTNEMILTFKNGKKGDEIAYETK